MATEVVDEALQQRISAAVEEMRGACLDTTGQGNVVPEGFDICVFAVSAKSYRKGGHTVEYVGDPNAENAVAFVKFGEPATVTQNVQRKTIFPKPGEGEARPTLWQLLLSLADLKLPGTEQEGSTATDEPQEAT